MPAPLKQPSGETYPVRRVRWHTLRSTSGLMAGAPTRNMQCSSCGRKLAGNERYALICTERAFHSFGPVTTLCVKCAADCGQEK